jgi:outer membrane biosynthesis protein TonB
MGQRGSMSPHSYDTQHSDPDLKHGAVLSAGIHLTILIIAFLGLPSWFDRTEPEPIVITLEMLPITGVTNVKPSTKPIKKPTEKPPVPTKAPPKPETSKPALPPKPQEQPKELPKEEPVPEKLAEVPKPKPVEKKPEPVKQKPVPTKKVEKTEEKAEDDSLDTILKDVQKQAKTEQDDTAKPSKETPVAAPNPTKSDAPYDPSQPLSLSEKDAIVSQFVQCWRLPAGAANDYSLKVSVDVALRPDGSVIGAALVPEQRGRYGSDMVFRAAADSAVRAVYKCNPIKNLPTDKYNSWKEMRLNFDPSMALY